MLIGRHRPWSITSYNFVLFIWRYLANGIKQSRCSFIGVLYCKMLRSYYCYMYMQFFSVISLCFTLSASRSSYMNDIYKPYLRSGQARAYTSMQQPWWQNVAKYDVTSLARNPVSDSTVVSQDKHRHNDRPNDTRNHRKHNCADNGKDSRPTKR